jgi:hypothetical protein
MYNGEVQIPEERLKDFLKTAETLQVRGLIDGKAEPEVLGPHHQNHREAGKPTTAVSRNKPN